MRHIGFAVALLCAGSVIGCDADEPVTPRATDTHLAFALSSPNMDWVPPEVGEEEEAILMSEGRITQAIAEILPTGNPRTLRLYSEATRPLFLFYPMLKHTATWAYPGSPPTTGQFFGDFKLALSGKREDLIDYQSADVLCGGNQGLGSVEFFVNAYWQYILDGQVKVWHQSTYRNTTDSCEAPGLLQGS